MLLRSAYKRVPGVLGTKWRLTEQKRMLGEARSCWSCVGAGEEDGDNTDSREETALSKTSTSEWSESLEDQTKMLQAEGIGQELTESRWETKSCLTAETE